MMESVEGSNSSVFLGESGCRIDDEIRSDPYGACTEGSLHSNSDEDEDTASSFRSSFVYGESGCRIEDEILKMRDDPSGVCSNLVLDSDSYDDGDSSTFQTLSTTSRTYNSSNKSSGICSFLTGETTYNDSITDFGENTVEGYQHRRHRTTNTLNRMSIDSTIHRSENDMKEVTIMPIGTKSRAHFLVKGSPKIPYSVAGICSKTGLSRDKSKPRYLFKSRRTGRIFHRIKPRPILMDTSQYSPNTQRKRTAVHQNTQGDQESPEVLILYSDQDDISLLTTTAFAPANPKASIKLELDAENTTYCIVNNQNNTKSPNENGLEGNNDTEGIVKSSKWRWRKEVPRHKASVLKNPFWNRKFSSKNMANSKVKVEETEFDQTNAGKPLANEEIDTARENEEVGKKLGKTTRGTRLGFLDNITRRFLTSQKSDENRGRGSEDTSDVVEEKGVVVNTDGSITNHKVVYTYRKDDNDISRELKVLKIDEDFVPEEKSSDILIRIEASTVSRMDSKIRHGNVCVPFQLDSEVITPGVDVVGTVSKCGDAAAVEYGIQPNDCVASLVGCGGNSTCIKLKASDVVKVPSLVSPASAAVVVESYLPAYQALLSGESDLERYDLSCLRNKNVLIFGGISPVGQAMIELSLLLGASKVYTTAVLKHHNVLKSLGATPLETDCRIWSSEIEKVDIAVDPSCDEPDKNSLQVMKPDGTFVCFGNGKHSPEGFSWVANTVLNLCSSPSNGTKTVTYNVFDAWENDMEASKSDLSYLFGLLKLEKIDPQVAGTLNLYKVKNAHSFLDGTRRIQGTFVCLPNAKKYN